MLPEVYLTYSFSVYASSDKIDDRREPRAIKAHTPALYFPAIQENAVNDEDDGR